MTEEQVKFYTEGYLDALYNFAWYKDGRMLVGCGIKTYKEAAEQAERKIREKHGQP